MADEGGWPRRREWYLKWGKASNRERVGIIWSGHRGLVVAVLFVLAGLGAWWFWAYVTAFGSWLDSYSETIRNLTLAVGVGAAIYGGWVAYQRSKTDRMRAETDWLRQVTESFAKSIELLGHEDRSVRLGAIYALERIARQNRDEHWPIMETLTAYVRDWSERKWLEVDADEQDSVGRGLRGVVHLGPAPADIQAVFTVLGRRRVDHERDDVAQRQLNLTGAYIVAASPDPPPAREFSRASFDGANLSRATLFAANLKGALLGDTNLEGAHLNSADLEGAYLYRTKLVRAFLQRANLKGAYLDRANLEGADLFSANLATAMPARANLKGAQLAFADLKGANLVGADLEGADLKGADLSTARNLTQDQLNSANGDKDTKIPEGLTRPKHWSD